MSNRRFQNQRTDDSNLREEIAIAVEVSVQEALSEFKSDLKRQLQNVLDVHLENMKREFVSINDLPSLLPEPVVAPATPVEADQVQNESQRKRMKEAVTLAIASIGTGSTAQWDLKKPVNDSANLAFRNLVWENVRNGPHAAMLQDYSFEAFNCMKEVLNEKIIYRRRKTGKPQTREQKNERAFQRRMQAKRTQNKRNIARHILGTNVPKANDPSIKNQLLDGIGAALEPNYMSDEEYLVPDVSYMPSWRSPALNAVLHFLDTGSSEPNRFQTYEPVDVKSTRQPNTNAMHPWMYVHDKELDTDLILDSDFVVNQLKHGSIAMPAPYEPSLEI
ncbi:hypothetical protein DM01DRAFT_1411083 [Hesseltinella vesiculosa]|uniref:Uncharacterized protein n=1 Tax=Hesseltinella vesiculosa TaxID=101127 RepID=A0A1X2G4Z0_9FUNG|nr:hypothetical protein DM01DRAFT_1411083 [Hesseltinella vesiculosa]